MVKKNKKNEKNKNSNRRVKNLMAAVGIMALLLVVVIGTTFLFRPGKVDRLTKNTFAGKAVESTAPLELYAPPETFVVSDDSFSYYYSDSSRWGGRIEVTMEGDDLYYNNVYVAHEDDSAWTMLQASGSSGQIQDWLMGNGEFEVIISDYFKEGLNGILVYGCSETTDSWSCHDNKWMLKTIEVQVNVVPLCIDNYDCPVALPYCNKDGVCKELPAYPSQPTASIGA